MTAAPVPTRLSRRLGVGDAVVIGLGSMLGAGVFAVFAPAARAAGSGLLVGLAMAAAVAFCNATSSAQLAARIPESGGTYAYGRARLSPFWGWLAGWSFVVGKVASCAAMALTFGVYAAPRVATPLAVVAVLLLTALDYRGVRKTAAATKVVVAVVLLTLAAVVVAGWAGDSRVSRLAVGAVSPYGVLQSAGLLFFAFAGYARIATLGEEVVDPARTIPRAIPLALLLTLLVYAAVALTALAVLGADGVAASSAPLAAVVAAGPLPDLDVVVRIGAAVACLGVLLSLLVGVSRTLFAMAANGDAPAVFRAVHPRFAVPHRAELVVGLAVALVVAVADVRGAIGFSSFAVLVYYAIANASAWTLRAEERRWPRWLAGAGVAGCLLLAASLPRGSVVAGAAVVALGAVVGAVVAAARRR